MMLLQRYIARQVFIAMALVLLVLGGLDLLLYTMDELRDVQGGYTAWQVLRYMLHIAPRHIYELLPPSALIGALAGLGSLAASNELVGMQAAGMSRWQVARSVMQPTLLVMAVGLVLGEYVAPGLEIQGEIDKAKALGAQVGLAGHWERDGHRYFHSNGGDPQGVLYGVTLFEFDEQQQLVHRIEAEKAIYQGPVSDASNRHRWQLVNGSALDFNQQNDTMTSGRRTFSEQLQELDLTPELLKVRVVEPANMKISDLWTFAQRFQQQGLDARSYFLNFWRKALQPFNTLVLVLMAVSFIFGPLRSVSMGVRVFSAICLGLVVTIGQKLLQSMSLVFQLPPLSSVLLPMLLCLLAGVLLLQRRA